MVTVGLSGPALIKAGVGVSAVMTASAGGEMDNFINEANAFLKTLVKKDLVANKMLDEYAERYAAILAISYNMAGYTSRIEAEDIINVHWARMQEIKELLEKSDVQDFLGV